MFRRDPYIFFFFNDTATTEIYTLSLHDALPISPAGSAAGASDAPGAARDAGRVARARGRGRRSGRDRLRLVAPRPDRKSTRLNSSHSQISYAVFCLKKKKKVPHQSKPAPVSLDP